MVNERFGDCGITCCAAITHLFAGVCEAGFLVGPVVEEGFHIVLGVGLIFVVFFLFWFKISICVAVGRWPAMFSDINYSH